MRPPEFYIKLRRRVAEDEATPLDLKRANPLAISSRSLFSVGHRKGGFSPGGGGGSYLAVTLATCPAKLSGVKLAIPILPLGLRNPSSSLSSKVPGLVSVPRRVFSEVREVYKTPSACQSGVATKPARR